MWSLGQALKQLNSNNLALYTVKNGSLLQHTNVSLLGHVSKIVSILLSKLNNCPNTDTLLCYCNYSVYELLSVLCANIHTSYRLSSRTTLVTTKMPKLLELHPSSVMC